MAFILARVKKNKIVGEISSTMVIFFELDDSIWFIEKTNFSFSSRKDKKSL